MGLCERCKKAQQTFHLTDIDRQGNKVERHLCDNCANEEGLLPHAKSSVDVSELLQSFVASSKGAAGVSHLICEDCGMTYVDFRNQGQLGCARDYDVFREPLLKLLERAHNGAVHHVGKTPATLGKPARKAAPDLARLKRQLQDAIAAEDYERAARLRDRIRELDPS